jgi:hypothetical protein
LRYGKNRQLVGRANHNLWNPDPKLDANRRWYFYFVDNLFVDNEAVQRIASQERR